MHVYETFLHSFHVKAKPTVLIVSIFIFILYLFESQNRKELRGSSDFVDLIENHSGIFCRKPIRNGGLGTI